MAEWRVSLLLISTDEVGLKNLSKFTDQIFSFGIDYLHGVLKTVTKLACHTSRPKTLVVFFRCSPNPAVAKLDKSDFGNKLCDTNTA